jgi:quinoprotein glucose dehydrogenase
MLLMGNGSEAGTGRYVWRLLALLIALCGLGFLFGGAWLASLGGSVYYTLAGLLLFASAVGLWRRSRWGLGLFGALIVATTIWALWEGGLDPWALLPRLGLLSFLWFLLLLPASRRSLSGGPQLASRFGTTVAGACAMLPFAVILGALLLAVFGDDAMSDQPALGQPLSSAGAASDWTHIGATAAGVRYSALTTITPQNVDRLRVAWTYTFGDRIPGGLQVTPIKIGDSLYVCNGYNVVVSLDPNSGRERWRFDPKVGPESDAFPVCRGVAYYRVPGASGACAERIYTNTTDSRLFAVDARTGLPCQDFGKNGQISLLDGMGDVPKGYYHPTSAPTVARGKIVVGGFIADGQYWGEPPGVIRAFDAVSGALAWAYDVGRPNDPAAPPPGKSYTLATPNSWAPMAYDDSLGLIYAPTGVATPDHFGGMRRPFDEEIGSSVLALDVETGRRHWVFQTVHHDLWDYDVASQPVLIDIPGPRGVIKGLLQATKRGETFLLDRVTGKPLDRVEERPVPQAGRVPEDRLAATQPFPTRMPSLDGGLLTERTMWGLTPFDQMYCRIKFRQARYEGPMTPLGLTPSIQYPGYLGGMNWGGLSVDAEHGIVIALTNHVANYMQMVPRKDADAMGLRPYDSKMSMGAIKGQMNMAVQAGQPYATAKAPFMSPLEVPCQQPPWSRLSAVDLASGKILWSKPLGTGKDRGPLGIASRLPLRIGVPAVGNSLTMRSGLTFIGASTDSTFRAFETRSGRLLWQAPIPASGNGGPMTYTSAGRQFVVIAAGGHRMLRAPNGDAIVAFALAGKAP